MDNFMDSDTDMSSDASSPPTGPYVKIIEQPAKCGVRFRYECEGRISGAIPGANSTTINPTYPTVKVFNYCGRAKVVVSCVTKSLPYRPHPHNLVGKKSCKDGICVMYIDNGNDMTGSFNNLGILCAKRKDIRERLKLREALKVDPFGTGFGHKSQAFKMIDLAVVRLCFQVYIEDTTTGEYSIQLNPVVSDAIYDKKAMSELSIAKLSHYSAPCVGGTEVILLCDRVIKDDIQIRFYEEKNDETYWEAFAEFKASDIHKHFAISFRTPKYCDENIQQPVSVNIQLKRPSDGGTSESLPFYLFPKSDLSSNKRQKSFQTSFPYNRKSTSVSNTYHRNTTEFSANNMELISEGIQVPRSLISTMPPQDYILPRLLTQPIQQYCQFDQTNEFLDLDIGINVEENDLAINSTTGTNNATVAMVNYDQYWNNCDINKDIINGTLINCNEYELSSGNENNVILDISSSNNNNLKQWSNNSPQKQFLCT